MKARQKKDRDFSEMAAAIVEMFHIPYTERPRYDLPADIGGTE